MATYYIKGENLERHLRPINWLIQVMLSWVMGTIFVSVISNLIIKYLVLTWSNCQATSRGWSKERKTWEHRNKTFDKIIRIVRFIGFSNTEAYGQKIISPPFFDPPEWVGSSQNVVSEQLTMLWSYIIQNRADEYATADKWIASGKITSSLHRAIQGTDLADEMGPEAMKRNEPPDEKFELLLPPTIKGFNMRRKKWYDLMADRVNDVEWNKEAFQNMVINRKAKDLVQALVSNQLAADTNTLSADLIEGKGNGLILLLHGSPGTGKTLTAESVAEIRKTAEKYLESVLHLGKLWKCVVLLDEADVFLEQRSLEDLERNALVAVFLRALEYYEGVLILTSNRNFFEKLDCLQDAAIDVDDLRDHLVEMKEEEVNGRQTRNAITTARQYAKWKGETLTYAKLKDVIEVAGCFDKYLKELHRGLTQDQLAKDEGVRLR
ncbi:hypothetical protein FHL15_001588 [Xylaria flabelliformis]|uniref:ATPase AAA-type core domain-containing protein n=1 Tax=Xylaria flabelliformis TaxID=2512241 RepID=A0A553IAT9_9PEZI|nr:hypothetical protein FHL15_001588 [Xylaria flabelliformis]